MPKKQQRETPGAVLKISFGSLWHTYGRMLRFNDVAVYDCRTTDDISDLEKIVTSPIIFKGIINEGAVKHGRWPIVGILPLPPELLNSKYFLEEVGNPNAFKLIQNGGYSFDHPRSSIIGITAGGIWDATQIEEIIQDYYSGKENVSLKIFYRDLGLIPPTY